MMLLYKFMFSFYFIKKPPDFSGGFQIFFKNLSIASRLQM